MGAQWNPLLETMSRPALRRRQLRRFRSQLRHVTAESHWYATHLDGIDPATITDLAAVRTVPTTSKDDLRDAQSTDDDLFGGLLTTAERDVTAYHQTSGTTGTPIRQADSWRDWEWWASTWATVLWAAGVRPDDRVFIPSTYNVFIAFWAAHYACERIGAMVIPGGGTSTEERVDRIADLRPTVLLTTPTYALRLGEVAHDRGLAAEDSPIDRIVCAGEIGASVPATRDRIEGYWDATVFDHAGATETGAWGFDCGYGEPGFHFNEAAFLVEILDDSDEPVAVGETGRLVVTPLDRRAQPVIRFEQGDRVVKGPAGTCSCGRSFRTAPGGIQGRVDDFVSVNGVLVSPRQVEAVVRRIEGLTDAYRVLVESNDDSATDVVTVRVERDTSAPPADQVVSTLTRRLKEACGLTVRVDLCPPGTLDRPTGKAQRITDKRGIDA